MGCYELQKQASGWRFQYPGIEIPRKVLEKNKMLVVVTQPERAPSMAKKHLSNKET